MGKKSKSKSKQTPSVSILTPTSINRVKFLPFLAKSIKAQTHTNIKEWLLLDSTKEDTDDNLDEMISQLRETGIPIVYIPKSEVTNKSIGSVRNMLNKRATGEYLFNFDDDDYYPPSRITHGLSVLQKSPCAGCADVVMYDADSTKLFKFRQMKSAVGCTICCSKEYANTHEYNEKVWHAEERKFVTHPDGSLAFKYLDPLKTILHTCHGNNTYNKRTLILQNLIMENNPKRNMDIIKTQGLDKFIKTKDLRKEYLAQFPEPEESEFDIVYFCGANQFYGAKWSVYDKSLGGSEQAVMNLSEQWSKKYKVAVYADIEDVVYNNIHFIHYKYFKTSTKYKTLILWRQAGVDSYRHFDIQAQTLMIDLHDNMASFEKFYEFIDDKIDKVDYFLLKSPFHKTCITNGKRFSRLSKYHRQEFESKCAFIPNGIRISKIIDPKVERNKYRMCYCSCYVRGLYPILRYLFPIIKRAIPQMELHIYYGMSRVKDKNFINAMNQLFQQDGVYEYGRQPFSTIVREKYMSNFHLYFTSTSVEIDCISIRESARMGCIPLLSQHGIFPTRPGIHLPGDPNVPQTYLQTANAFIQMFKNTDFEAKRLECQNHYLATMDWEIASKMYEPLMQDNA